METRVIRVKTSKCIIIFIGYFSLCFASLLVWGLHLFNNEYHIAFPILLMFFGLGTTTPIIIKLLRRDFRLVLTEKGFENRTGFNRSKFISWDEVNTITHRNGSVSISLLNEEEFLKSSSLLVRLLSKINKSSITLVNWYLEEDPIAIYHMMHNYAFQYQYKNLDLVINGSVSIVGFYDTPYMESYINMVELEIEHGNIVEFVEDMNVFTSLHNDGQRVLTKIVFLDSKGENVLNKQSESEVKRFLCFIGHVREGSAIKTPYGYIKLPKISPLPDRLKSSLDFRNVLVDFKLYQDVRPLRKSELDGTPYVEFSSIGFSSYKDIENWREDSIYLDLESADIVLMFIPKEIKFQIYSVHSFTKDESEQFINNMLAYINGDNKGENYDEILKQEEFELDDGTYFYLKHINGFMENPDVVKQLLKEVIDFIEKHNHEFSILGV